MPSSVHEILMKLLSCCSVLYMAKPPQYVHAMIAPDSIKAAEQFLKEKRVCLNSCDFKKDV